MSRLKWDQIGERLYTTGVEQAAVYVQGSNGEYGAGEAWNGLTAVSESPTGAEVTALWANDTKYGELVSAEEFAGSIEAYMYPDGFKACNGEATVVKGFTIGQQARMPFGMVYKSLIGNDVMGTAYGYELNIVYGARVTPSEKAHNTVNESPEAGTMSWEFTTTPVDIPGFKPSAKLTFNSTEVDAEKLAALEAILYGSDDTEDAARLPLPEEIIDLMKGEEAAG